MEQSIVLFNDGYKQIESILECHEAKRFLLVCGGSFKGLKVSEYFNSMKIPHTVFNSFAPNPKMVDIKKGAEIFRQDCCDSIVSVGGGSSIDVAKCIQLYSENSDVIHIAVPTTAGTGSESTTFAVAYIDGVKHSLEAKLPDYAILEESVLETLPLSQKKAAMFDTLCQGIESFWSKLATSESCGHAGKAIKLILDNHGKYLTNDKPNQEVLRNMMRAANFSGQAINISKTTSAHAMSYGITSMFNVPHGIAVALCLTPVWRLMEKRGLHIKNLDALISVDTFETLAKKYSVSPPYSCTEDQLAKLCATVNAERMNNNPLDLDSQDIFYIYRDIFITALNTPTRYNIF